MTSPEPAGGLGAVFGPSAKERAAGPPSAPDPSTHTLAPRRRRSTTSQTDATPSTPAPTAAPSPAPPPAAVTPAAAPTTPPAAQPPAPAPAPTAVDDQDDDASAGALVSQVSVYLLPAAVTAARRWRARTGRSNARLAFEAIAAHRSELTTLLAGYDERRDPLAASADALFPPAPRSRRAANGPRRVLWTLKATADQLAVLDRLVDEARATSRSELIAAAVEAHILTSRASRRR